MKRFAVLVFALTFLVGCSSEGSSTAECTTNLVLVTDTGGIDDRSFNQGTYEGLLKLQNENDSVCVNPAIQSNTEADYVPNLTSVSGGSNDLVVAPGFKFFDALTEVAAANPDQKYLLIDAVVELDNVSNALFAVNEASYLAGVAAAHKAVEAKETKVGFIGGAKISVIEDFEIGFTEGVKSVDPTIEVVSQYVDTFSDVTIGRTAAQVMFNQGVYIIFHAAGDTGNGVINAAREIVEAGEKQVWVIGVDRDQFEDGKLANGESSVILTSVLKRVDVASHDVALSVHEGNFKSGILEFDLANNGVGLPETNPNLTEDIINKVNESRESIVNGTVKVGKAS